MHGAHGIFFATRFFSPTDYTDHSDFNSSFFRLLALLVILFTLSITQINLVSALAYYKIRCLTASKALYGFTQMLLALLVFYLSRSYYFLRNARKRRMPCEFLYRTDVKKVENTCFLLKNILPLQL
jgi:hypothetical protein